MFNNKNRNPFPYPPSPTANTQHRPPPLTAHDPPTERSESTRGIQTCMHPSRCHCLSSSQSSELGLSLYLPHSSPSLSFLVVVPPAPPSLFWYVSIPPHPS